MGNAEMSECIGAASPRGERVFCIAVLAAYAVLLAILGWHHEPWRDEADAWLVVRDNSLAGIFDLAPYMGTPVLWYLVLYPVVKLGAPYAAMRVVGGAVALAAVALLVFKAPFPRWIRLLLPFTYLLSYEYAVIARSYGLSVLLLFCVAALYRRRLERPWLYFGAVGLLFQTNAHGAMLGAVFLLLGAVEVIGETRRPQQLGALVLAASLAGLAMLQVLPAPADAQVLLRADYPTLDLLAASWREPLIFGGHASPSGRELPASPTRTVAAFAFLALVLVVLRSRGRALAILVLSLMVSWGFMLGVYEGNLRHWGFLFLALLVSLWIAFDERAARGIPALERRLLLGCFALLLAVNVVGSSAAWVREVRHPFSMSMALAGFLEREGLLDSPLAGHRAPPVSSLVPYLEGSSIYYPGSDRDGSHMRWDLRYTEGLFTQSPELIRRIRARYPGEDPLIVLNFRARHPALRLVHDASDPDTIVAEENFYVYRLAGS